MKGVETSVCQNK